MTRSTRGRARARGWRAGSRSPSSRRRPSGSSGALARGLLDAGWSAGRDRAGPGRSGRAGRGCRSALVALRGRWTPAAPQRRPGRWSTARWPSRAPSSATSPPSSTCRSARRCSSSTPLRPPSSSGSGCATASAPAPSRSPAPALAALGLVLVLDLVSGADLSLPGVLWALAAMVGAATYFVISADEDNGLPPIALAAGGLVVGAVGARACSAWSGCCRCAPRRRVDVRRHARSPGGCRCSSSGVVTAAIAYTTGIAAGRRLGSRLASFVALLEVVAGVLFAWVLLDELPRTDPAGRRPADPGRRRLRQARRARQTADPPSLPEEPTATDRPSHACVCMDRGCDRGACRRGRPRPSTPGSTPRARAAAVRLPGHRLAARGRGRGAVGAHPGLREVVAGRRTTDPDAYVRRMVVNAHVSAWRRSGRRELVGRRGARHVVADPPTASPPATRSGGCAALPPQQRAAVVLRYYEDLEYAEIAAILGVAQATVRSHVHRALAAMRDRAGRTDDD